MPDSATASSAPSVGETAPDFELYTTDMESWRLSDHRGRPVVVLFFPGAFTSVCTTELNRVNDELPAFGDAAVVGISTDSPFALDAFRRDHGFSFPLLSDHDAEVSAAYGAKYENDFTPMDLDRVSKRAAFVLDGDGNVRYAEVLDNAGKQPDFEAIMETVESLAN